MTPALALLAFVVAAPPADGDERSAAVGRPTSVSVNPPSVTLRGPRDARQLVVTGTYVDGTCRDLTPFASASDVNVVDVQDGLFLRPKATGTADMTVSAGGKSVRVPVTVDMGATAPVSFRRDVVGALNVGGCNMGACHGTPSGKGGFKLSLRGFDPAADYTAITREQGGRRIDIQNAAESLLVKKAVGRVPHEGGVRFGSNSLPAEVVTAWIAVGRRDDEAELPPLKAVTVTPAARVLAAPAKWQQLAVDATFADGARRDVTRLTNYGTSDAAVADVSPTGLVEFKRPGEVAILCRYLETMVSVRLTYLEPPGDFVWPNPPERNFVDAHVFAKLRRMSIPPSDLCTDGEFVRRTYLDAVGRLPTPAEATAFLADPSPGKRDALVDALVEMPLFADFWALKWADVLRSTRKTIQPKGSYALREWLRSHWLRNTPVDAVVRELLTASGNSYANPPANYYRVGRDPQVLAETTAQLFLGARMGCAKCHNHPYERWTQDDYYGFAAFFARTARKPDPVLADGKPDKKNPTAEVVYVARSGEVIQPRTGKTMPPHFPGGADAVVPPGADRRAVLAAWLTAPDNPFFAKSVVNRVWFHVVGRGIVDPVDDFRESNPSSNDELLDALAKDFVAHGYDLKHLVRTVMKSRTYGLSAEPTGTNGDDARYFSHAVTKLLTAEQLLDAVADVTGVPERFAGLPAGTRAVQLPDGEGGHPFLKAFGQPARELACECERESDGNLGQALQLLNGPTVNGKVRAADNRVGRLLAAKASDADILNELYLAALSRPPLPGEVDAARGHVAKATDRRRAWEDLMWAVVNTREFLFRH